MTRGSRTPAEKVAKFRAHYVKTGNVCAASREVGIPYSTGQGLAKDANEDPDFVKSAPQSTRLRRLDETQAARHPVLRWTAPETPPEP